MLSTKFLQSRGAKTSQRNSSKTYKIESVESRSKDVRQMGPGGIGEKSGDFKKATAAWPLRAAERREGNIPGSLGKVSPAAGQEAGSLCRFRLGVPTGKRPDREMDVLDLT